MGCRNSWILSVYFIGLFAGIYTGWHLHKDSEIKSKKIRIEKPFQISWDPDETPPWRDK